MSPSKKRPPTKVDITPYLEQDVVVIKPKDNEIRMEVGSDRCRTVVMDKDTALIFALSVVKHSKQVWGAPFMTKFLTHVEVL